MKRICFFTGSKFDLFGVKFAYTCFFMENLIFFWYLFLYFFFFGRSFSLWVQKKRYKTSFWNQSQNLVGRFTQVINQNRNPAMYFWRLGLLPNALSPKCPRLKVLVLVASHPFSTYLSHHNVLSPWAAFFVHKAQVQCASVLHILLLHSSLNERSPQWKGSYSLLSASNFTSNTSLNMLTELFFD